MARRSKQLFGKEFGYVLAFTLLASVTYLALGISASVQSANNVAAAMVATKNSLQLVSSDL